MKYCPNCGSGVDASDSHCYECGEDLTEKGTEHPETEENGEVPENEEEAEEETEAEAKEETETEEEKEAEEEAEEAQGNGEVPENEAEEEVKDEETRGSSIDITNIEAVGETKAEALRDAGYETIDDLREATQEEIAEVENIGEALSARIKSNADRMEVKKEARKDEDSGISINPKALFVLMILVIVGGAVLLTAGGGDAGLDTSPDSSDTQDSETTDGSAGGNEEAAGTDSSENGATGSEDTGQSDDIPSHEIGETFTVGSGDRVVEYTVEEVTTADYIGSSRDVASRTGTIADGVLVVVTISMKSLASEPFRVTTDHMQVVDAEGRVYSADTITASYISLDDRFDANALNYEELQPGLTYKKNVIYDVQPGGSYRLIIRDVEDASPSEPHLVPFGQVE